MSEDGISPHDAEDLAGCFRRYARSLFGYACVLTRGDQALAEDLVQAAFEAAARAWRQVLGGLAEEQRVSWLRRTLANMAASSFRREAALRERLSRIEVRYRTTPPDPVDQAFSAIVLDRCWRVIQGLPDRQYAVALLRWQLDMKQREIAAVLGMDPGTVSAHLHRVRRKLIAQLGPDHPFTRDDPEGASS